MDGVIVDSAYYHMRSWQETFGAYGITYTEADFKRSFGQRNDEIIPHVLGKEFTPEKYTAIVDAKETAFRRLIRGNVRAFPGVLGLLGALDTAGISQALVSSTPRENIDLITDSLNIKKYFDVVLSGDDVTEGKPSPQGYLLAAQRLAVSPADCVVIEDAVAGVQAARNGGMKCIAVTNTHPAASLREADLVVSSLKDVDMTVVRKLAGHR
jgi:beta-phosphoglucomutase